MSDQQPPNGDQPDRGDQGRDDAPGAGIDAIEIQSEMEQSFLDYAMSVIVSRALPDARDGLKPVHRRILWGMYDTNVRPDRSHVKCAKVVGEVMGNYHPHGDTAIYDALVRLGQPFSLRHPLIDPHGNFGSPSDPPAAMRYTECRLAPLAMHMLAGIDQDTVDFEDNFDGSAREPKVLPARFPNLLVNGGQGIAVGMATNIPPHNLGEVADAAAHLLANPDADNDALMEFVKGPDFPTGGMILGRSGIVSAYKTGRGSIKVRARAEIEEDAKGGTRIVVSEIPYQTSIEAIEEKAADLVQRREIDGIRAIRNESAKGVTRLVFELKRDAPALVILNNLYRATPLQTTYSVNMVALDDGVPRTMTLRDALVAWADHQIEVVTRRSQFLLDKAQRELHINEGLLKALDLIDAIIAAIRASEDRGAARDALMAEPFEFSEIQANHILDMQLGRLTRLGRGQIEEKIAQLRAEIEELEAILGDDAKLRSVIVAELDEIRQEFATARRTELAIDPGEFAIEDLIDDEDLVFTLSAGGYVKTVSADEFRAQARGGRGVAGAALKDEDVVSTIIHTSAHAYLLFFTNMGKVFRLKAHEVPMASRQARGMAIVNLLQLAPDETIAAVIDTRDYETNRFLVFVTAGGQIKKTRFNEYDKSRRDGLIAINLRDGDELVRVLPTNGEDVCLITRSGRLMRFDESEVRAMGRAAAGVRGIRLRGDDRVVAATAVRPGDTLLFVTDRGFGKRTSVDGFAVKHRGGQGVTGIKLSEDKGVVVACRVVGDEDQVLLVSSSGVLIRMRVDSISMQGPYATGVKVMALAESDRVAAVAPVLVSDTAEGPDDAAADGTGAPVPESDAAAGDATDGAGAADDAGAGDEDGAEPSQD